MTPADDRLADLPMTPVECRRCHAIVRVRKSSWEQTSIQWDRDGIRTCLERPFSLSRGNLRTADFSTCAGLRAAIAEAALSGELPLAEDSGSRDGRGPAGAAAEERAVAQ